MEKQQELSRSYTEEVIEDLQFQLGKMIRWSGRVENALSDLIILIEDGGISAGPKEEPPQKIFTPEMRAKIAMQVKPRGILLTDDRIEIEGTIGAGRTAALEFFTVVRGGKEHEALVVLQPPDTEENLPVGYAASINIACQALNLRRGKPTRYSRAGGDVKPAEGEPVYLYIEWERADGERVRAAAEDLVYDQKAGRTLLPGTWIYVGSTFLRNRDTGVREYMADLNGHVVSTFGSAHAILSNKTPDATEDDTSNFFCGYASRIPEVGTRVKLVISAKPLDGVHEFPEGTPEDGEDDGDGEDD